MNFGHLTYFTSVYSRQLLAFRYIYRITLGNFGKDRKRTEETHFKLADLKTFGEIAGLENREGELG